MPASGTAPKPRPAGDTGLVLGVEQLVRVHRDGREELVAVAEVRVRSADRDAEAAAHLGE